jgi:hypothetical protein
MNRTSVTLLLVAIVVGLISTAAHAGTYTVSACFDAPAGQFAAFASSNSSPSTLTADAHCPPAPGESFSGLLLSTTLMAVGSPDGATAAWTTSAPPGTTLDQLSVRRYFGKRDENWDVSVVKADGSALETCDFNPATQLECTVGSATPTAPANYVTYANLDTSSVSFRLRCDAAPFTCLSGTSQRQAWIALYAATAQIVDPVAPVLGTPSGSLVDDSSHAGWHRGVESLSVPASDSSGIKATGVSIDGTAVAAVDQSCDFTQMRPCPAEASPAIAVDLASLSDGPHELRMSATDAATQASSVTRTLNVDQHPPAAPVGLATTTLGDGRYAASWTNPGQGAAAPITGASYEVCRVAGNGCPIRALTSGVGVHDLPPFALPADSGRYALRVALVDQAGNTDASRVAIGQIDTDSTTAPPPPPGRREPPSFRPAGAARVQRLLTIRGTVAASATGSVTGVVTGIDHRRPQATATTSVRRSAWRLQLELPRGLRRQSRYLLVLKYAGDDQHRPAAISRTLIATGPRARAAAKRRFRFARSR